MAKSVMIFGFPYTGNLKAQCPQPSMNWCCSITGIGNKLIVIPSLGAKLGPVPDPQHQDARKPYVQCSCRHFFEVLAHQDTKTGEWFSNPRVPMHQGCQNTVYTHGFQRTQCTGTLQLENISLISGSP